ncbi:MAG: succinate dehydrogenase cytochrome b subunit [Flavobacteriales bacterium]|nr:succinate dehydrogenase cytochrome b subunit [Flavobacteriales bacterium]MCX7768881.1 succinate dehydrogenase cytochrome b subunit [Flavobacteriales bacterium]MDW8410840.1 succinate dehydrogenase cytochrome b subunit [Flavobacteriales bacterium]
MELRAQHGLLKSLVAKKILMALTGLFLCLFLVVHLSGNLQLLIPGYSGRLQFNSYAVFMTHFPLIKIISYVLYLSIIIHVLDALVLTIRNRRARTVDYAVKSGYGSTFASRNMGILGSLILIFLVLHLANFWYKYKFGEMPYMVSPEGHYVSQKGEAIPGAVLKEGHLWVDGVDKGPAMKDLYEVVRLAFGQSWIVAIYVLSMIPLGYHLAHGFQSGFQTLGLRFGKAFSVIRVAGWLFAIIIPLGFAIIPLVFYFFPEKLN